MAQLIECVPSTDGVCKPVPCNLSVSVFWDLQTSSHDAANILSHLEECQQSQTTASIESHSLLSSSTNGTPQRPKYPDLAPFPTGRAPLALFPTLKLVFPPTSPATTESTVSSFVFCRFTYPMKVVYSFIDGPIFMLSGIRLRFSPCSLILSPILPPHSSTLQTTATPTSSMVTSITATRTCPPTTSAPPSTRVYIPISTNSTSTSSSSTSSVFSTECASSLSPLHFYHCSLSTVSPCDDPSLTDSSVSPIEHDILTPAVPGTHTANAGSTCPLTVTGSSPVSVISSHSALTAESITSDTLSSTMITFATTSVTAQHIQSISTAYFETLTTTDAASFNCASATSLLANTFPSCESRDLSETHFHVLPSTNPSSATSITSISDSALSTTACSNTSLVSTTAVSTAPTCFSPRPTPATSDTATALTTSTSLRSTASASAMSDTVSFDPITPNAAKTNLSATSMPHDSNLPLSNTSVAHKTSGLCTTSVSALSPNFTSEAKHSSIISSASPLYDSSTPTAVTHTTSTPVLKDTVEERQQTAKSHSAPEKLVSHSQHWPSPLLQNVLSSLFIFSRGPSSLAPAGPEDHVLAPRESVWSSARLTSHIDLSSSSESDDEEGDESSEGEEIDEQGDEYTDGDGDKVHKALNLSLPISLLHYCCLQLCNSKLERPRKRMTPIIVSVIKQIDAVRTVSANRLHEQRTPIWE